MSGVVKAHCFGRGQAAGACQIRPDWGRFECVGAERRLCFLPLSSRSAALNQTRYNSSVGHARSGTHHVTQSPTWPSPICATASSTAGQVRSQAKKNGRHAAAPRRRHPIAIGFRGRAREGGRRRQPCLPAARPLSRKPQSLKYLWVGEGKGGRSGVQSRLAVGGKAQAKHAGQTSCPRPHVHTQPRERTLSVQSVRPWSTHLLPHSPTPGTTRHSASREWSISEVMTLRAG